ncbi:MAG: hypothetical protein ACK4HM_05250 [Thermosynechococcus sp.]
MLGFTTEELKQTRFYQEVYVEAREEGLRQGEALVALLATVKTTIWGFTG